MRALIAVGLAAALTGACTSQDEPEPSPPPSASLSQSASPTPSPEPQPSPSGTPTPAVTGDVITGLQAPWSIAMLGPTAALISQRDNAQVVLLSAADGGWTAQPAGTVPAAAPSGEGGLLGLAVAPSGTEVYAMFTARSDNRVVRMPWDGSRLGEPAAVLTGLAKAGIHNGGRIAFGPDGMLYIGTGDASNSGSAQDIGSLSGKVLRMAPDGSVPADNPIPGSLVYSLGHRNVQGLAFDDAGRLWASEFGNQDVDEINLIKAGGNYGWPIIEGPGGRAEFIDPAASFSPTAIASPSGIAFAQGSLWIASLRGQTMFQVPLDGESAAAPIAHFKGTYGRLRDVVVSPSGSLWLLTNNTDGRGDPRAGDDRIIEVQLAG